MPQPANPVVQGEFVNSPEPSAHWQQRRNGIGYTFRADLQQLESRLSQKFTTLHRHVSQNHNLQQGSLAESFNHLDERILGRFQTLDRKLNAILQTQRDQAARRLTLWLMGVLGVLGVYVLLVHPLLRQPKTVVPTLTTPQPVPQQPQLAPQSQPMIPLPEEIPPN